MANREKGAPALLEHPQPEEGTAVGWQAPP
jgi:hypothetical protein